MDADALTLARAQLERDRAVEHRRQGWIVRLYLAFGAVVACVYAWTFLTAALLEPRWLAAVAFATALLCLGGIGADVRGHRLGAAAISQAAPILPALLYASAFSVDAGFASMLMLGALGVAVTVPEDRPRWRIGLVAALVAGIAMMQIAFPRSRAWSQLPTAETSALAAAHRTLLTVGLFTLALILTQALVRARRIVDASLRLSQAAADTDTLTGLPHRRPVRERMESLARRGRPFAVALADVDHFKALNDTFGHDCGDETLRHVARAMLDGTREDDLVGRWGGEEFVSVLRAATESEAADAMERVRVAVAAASPVCAVADHPATVSIGVAMWEPGEEVDEALRRADSALYEAKRRGRDRVVTVSEPPGPAWSHP
ncbi:diguanylate cyclase [Demequina sp. NBRC 110052]|uniref:GGDEF domain-containing protein n=1 Tax=Demequina sp. NBRC 110052 TaxID=1570341 RepID=UPI0013564B47|nr:GGDEF domain-containing protein [Demequina sp. NBRC 110052]